MKIGDVVVLKSGGHLMTIDRIKGERAKCVWFNELGWRRTETFSLAALTRSEKPFGTVAGTVAAPVGGLD